MPERFVLRRIDVLLVDLVQALDGDFPELPYGYIARCVDVARRGLGETPPAGISGIVDAVERVARADLERLRASAPAESV